MKTSVDFHHYKEGYLQRQIRRQLTKNRLKNHREYSDLIERDDRTPQNLINNLTIHVTRFFRDPEVFVFLQEHVLPLLWKQHGSFRKREFRIWITGCSTGEEAYSVAISLLESVRPNLSTHPVRIFATDVDEIVIAQARKGEYPPEALANLSTKIRKKYFLPGKVARIVPEVRKQIIFGRHDLLQGASINHLDLIFCRNVLIFLNSAAQEEIYRKFYENLNPEGILVLGKAESPPPHFRQKKLVTLSSRNRIYQKATQGKKP
ncbi:MAG: protein-glutamate O-methyltransferase CheR [Deltaproteobacteria bacterium]|nr:protein-glutamate O-methyltransferase CheR [Deltaproteobacteria bacterium]